MAEQKAAPETAAAPASGGGNQKQTLLLMGLALINMIVVLGVGFMVWQGKKKEAAAPKIEHVIQGEAQTQEAEKSKVEQLQGRLIPLETFIVNLAGSKGRRVAKVNMELEVTGDNIVTEIEQRKAQIRDIIIIILSAKNYDQLSSKEGKDGLRSEIKDSVNGWLTKGKIEEVYFTEFIYN
ncbi:MAG: flagellar basal body-associated FliL family protein [Bdellovibrio sp.]